ncbi:MAG: membrane protein insertase YidC [Bacteroidota bacterium]
MDKNSVIGLLIIALILVVYGIINRPSEEERQKMQQVRDSVEQVQQMKEDSQQAETKPQESAETKTQPQQAKREETTQQTTDTTESGLQDIYGAFAVSAKGQQKFAVLENDLMKIRISTRGGRPYSVKLKEYETYKGEPLVLFNGDHNTFGFNFFANKRQIATNDLYFELVGDRDSLYARENNQTVRLRLHAGNDRYIEYVYSLDPNTHMVNFDIRFHGMNEVIPQNYTELDLRWDIKSPRLEKSQDNRRNTTTIGYKYYQDEVDDLSSVTSDESEEELQNRLKWVAFKQKFFSSILVSDNYFANSRVEVKNIEDSEKYQKYLAAEIGVPYESESRYEVPMSFYFGPNQYNVMKQYNQEFEGLIPLGWAIFKWVNKYIIIPIFDWLDNSIANYGIIILLLTLLIKAALFPLTYKSYLSQAKMRVLKPEIDELNKKYPKKEDNMKKQRAMMDLYKKAGVNPMGGCLPMLLQLPILIAMVQFFPSSFELRQEGFLWADDLSSYDSILELPFEIPFYGDHVSLFTLMMAVTLIFTTRINSAQMSGSQQMPGMKFFTTYFMPVMLLFIFNNFAAGLSYYFFLSNVITLGQTLLIRNFVDDEEIHRKLKENKKKPQKKSKMQQRLEEAQQKQAQKKKGYQPKK